MRRLWILCVLLLLSASLAFAANTHNTPSEAFERQAWFGDAQAAYAVSGCLPPASGTTTTGTFACAAYVKASGGELVYVTQPTKTVGPLSGGDGTYWIAIHRDGSTAVGGWTRQVGTHYLWQKSSSQPATPANSLMLSRLTVASSAITATLPLLESYPFWNAKGPLTINVRHLGAKGDGTADAATPATWRIPPSLYGATLDGGTFGTYTWDGADTEDFVALRYAFYLAEQWRGSHAPGGGQTTRFPSIRVIIPNGVYTINRLLPLYYTHLIVSDGAVLIQSGGTGIFELLQPAFVSIHNLQMQGGTSAISVLSPNLDASQVECNRCQFQGQTQYPITAATGNMPKVLLVRNSQFIHTNGGIAANTNNTLVENNWFEFVHTDPLLANGTDGQAVFRGNRVIPGTFLAGKSKPAAWVTNTGQLVMTGNIFSGEDNTASRLLDIEDGATYTVVRDNIGVTDGDANIKINGFPYNITIENNFFQEQTGAVVDDDYALSTNIPASATLARLATSNNVYRGNTYGNTTSGTQVAFLNGGRYFTIDDGGYGRSRALTERPVLDPQNNSSNRWTVASEVWAADWTIGSGTSQTNNYAVAPDGTTTAMRLTSAGGGSLAREQTAVATGAEGFYTLSVYVKNIAGNNSLAVKESSSTLNIVLKALNKAENHQSGNWTRVALTWYNDGSSTYRFQVNLGASGEMHFWGWQIDRGVGMQPYLYKASAAKTLAFPTVGPEKPQYYAASIPAAGDWKAGQIVWNTAGTVAGSGGSQYVIIGWYRLTTGTANVLNTDWVEMRTLTGT